jgi:hypothetical protein
MIEQSVAKPFEAVGLSPFYRGTPQVEFTLADLHPKPAVTPQPRRLVVSLPTTVNVKGEWVAG